METIEISNKQTLDLFSFSGTRLFAVVQKLTESQLNLPSAPGEWTIRQIVHHVSDDADVWSMNIKHAIVSSGATVRFESYPGNEAWAEALQFGDREVQTALDLIRAHTAYLVALLKHFPDAWQHTVVIVNADGVPTGHMTVQEIMHMLAEHMLEHLDAIESTLAKQHRN